VITLALSPVTQFIADKADMLKGDDVHVLTFQGEARRLEQDLDGALKDLGKAHELQPKLVYILGM
jgi:hypothetical protein